MKKCLLYITIVSELLLVSGIPIISVSNTLSAGVKPTLIEAYTRDLSGNGYLDATELLFDSPVVLPQNFDLQHIIVNKENIFFRVDSMVPVPLTDNKKYLLYLCENQDTGLQSGWELFITIDHFDSIEPVKNFLCEDGAAPIISYIEKTANGIDDKTNDIVTITFSEDIYNPNGSSFLSAGPTPQTTFQVWFINLDLVTVLLDSMINGINKFESHKNNQVTFKMSNGQNLNKDHLISVDYLCGYVADKLGNVITANNQRLRVDNIKGKLQIKSWPSAPYEISPNYKLSEQGNDLSLTLLDLEIAYNIVRLNGGTYSVHTIANFDFETPFDGEMLIHDSEGYRILHKKRTIYISSLPTWQVEEAENNAQVTFVLYWDGINDEGVAAKEGTHYITYIFKNGKHSVENTSIVYVEDKETSADKHEQSPCGASFGLAFIPPFGIRVVTRYRRRKKKRRSRKS